MNTFLHQPRLPADELLRALRTRFPLTRPQRATTPAGVEVIGVPVRGDGVRRAWEEWRRRHGETGWWPFVTVASPEGLAAGGSAGDASALEESLAEVVGQDHDARAASVVVSGFRWSMYRVGGDAEDLEGWRDDYDPDRLAPQLGPAIDAPLPGVSRWACGGGGVAGRSRWLVLVPARGGHEVPVVLPRLLGTGNWFGYGDRVLTPADDAALLRRWQEQWGAELLFVAGDSLELAVAGPPLGPRDAAQAATELLGYCPDTVQDPRTAGDGMVRSTVWSLWWD
ncbi:DUF4253 domain-containing protein [Streptomyces sp. NPDC058052]|uniref:DUF4253 domain-containing protein n=1 Tax=Streptomyces sp. NPDC058052 TaxID=3346316 RepID=UPI0036E23FF9